MGLSGGGAIDAVPRLVLKLEKIHIRMICYVLHCSEHFPGLSWMWNIDSGPEDSCLEDNNPAHGCSVIPGISSLEFTQVSGFVPKDNP